MNAHLEDHVMTTVWGIHMGEHVGDKPLDGNYVAIGWPELGDIRNIPDSRDAFKTKLKAAIKYKSEGAIPVHAGVLYRFVHVMKSGDLVVFPSKHDRSVNIGRFTGEAEYEPADADHYPNHRSVQWLGKYPRSDFSQSALYEIGSALTLFMVKTHANEFLSKVGVVPTVSTPAPEENETDDDTAIATVSQRAEETTSDFIIRRLAEGLNGYQFEEFIAHILECMGYTARVTQKSGDGGVDIIAHIDALGFQPPIIKVQCKKITGQSGAPEVNQLLGTLGEGEYGLFVNLGSFTRQANDLERTRPKLRLIDGEQLVAFVLMYYSKISPRYRSLLPLKQIYVPDFGVTNQ